MVANRLTRCVLRPPTAVLLVVVLFACTSAPGQDPKAGGKGKQPDFIPAGYDDYQTILDKLGIKADLRIVDSSQYQQRLNTFDFDIVVAAFPQSESPGNEQRDFWGSDAASKEGSRNIIGIRNPAVDQLIDRIIHAKDRQWLVAATRALDRVLLWNNYVVPQWYSPFDRLAYWDMYRHPQRLPARAASFLRVWWWDGEAAKRLSSAPG